MRFSIELVADVKADDPLNDAQVAFYQYALKFTDTAGVALGQAVYHDVHGVEGEFIDLADLARWMSWSPNEDFVILPAEGWITAPGTIATTAVNLNPRYRWTSAYVAIDERVWIDSLRVVGNDMSDCAYSVVMFDGRTGETRTIKETQSPVGFAMTSVPDTSIFIQSLPDNCATDEQRAAFVTECWEFSLTLFAVRPVPCSQ